VCDRNRSQRRKKKKGGGGGQKRGVGRKGGKKKKGKERVCRPIIEKPLPGIKGSPLRKKGGRNVSSLPHSTLTGAPRKGERGKPGSGEGKKIEGRKFVEKVFLTFEHFIKVDPLFLPHAPWGGEKRWKKHAPIGRGETARGGKGEGTEFSPTVTPRRGKGEEGKNGSFCFVAVRGDQKRLTSIHAKKRRKKKKGEAEIVFLCEEKREKREKGGRHTHFIILSLDVLMGKKK